MRQMENEILELLRENNAMMKRVCAWIDKVESQEYRDGEDFRAFMINMCADVLVDNNQRQNRLNGGNNDNMIFYR